MIDRRDLGSWLEGPQGAGGQDQRWPGERLGRPENGTGSVARLGRRVGALCVDWALCLVIAAGLLGGGQWQPLAVLLVMTVLLVGTAGSTIGHAVFGLRVVRLDGGPAGPVKALVRTVLLCLVIPPAVWDRDQRGIHDRAAGTLIVRR